MKVPLELVFALVLHPIAVIRGLITVFGRSDVGAFEKLLWTL